MNANSNIRMKSQNGNRVEDERRDARILDDFVNGTAIGSGSGADRASQAY